MRDIRLENVTVRLDDREILHAVDFYIAAGEIHALLGEHGSGKTTVCNTLAGFVQPESGVIRIDGRRFSGLNVRQAQARGIRLVNQDNRLVETMSVASNLFLNNPIAYRSPFVSYSRINRMAREYLSQWDVEIDPGEKAANLHEGDRLIVNMLKHLYAQPSLLILDESFEKLTSAHLEKTKRFLEKLCREGMALLVVTHLVEELFDFAHHVMILRSGSVLFRDEIANTDSLDLVRLAYTQISPRVELDDPGWEFTSLLKYNRAILERLPVNLVVVDEQLRIKIVNDSARSFLGLVGRELYNTSWEQLDIAHQETVHKILTASIEEQTRATHLNVKMVVDDETVVTDITVLPIFDGKRFLGVILLINDVTEKEKMRDRMMLAEKLTSVGLLSAGVAHEINNPLEIIYNYVDHIRLRNRGNEETEAALTRIENEIASISEITKNLILFGDSSSNESETVEINEFLSETIDLVRHNARRKSIDVSFNRSAAEAFIDINPLELKQVVLNIMRNAFEAMPDGGAVDVAVQRVVKNDAANVIVLFRDTGPGLGSLSDGDLFLPFYSTKSRSQENLGLGLSISYSIVQRHRGRLSARTHPLGGAEFVVEFPSVSR